jgi:DNA replication protein DnaC
MNEMTDMNRTLTDFFDEQAEQMKKEMKPGDYFGEDGLIHCGICGMPKQKRCEDGFLAGHVVRISCRCEAERMAKEEAEEKERQKNRHVAELKQRGFLSKTMQEWTFTNDNRQNPQMALARKYVENWDQVKEKNIGLLVWGDVGCGKSYLAGAIANALMDQEIAVMMTNFSAIINDLSGTFEGRNEYLNQLFAYPLLIIDDFGMERGTEYGLEQVYNVIDGRYRSGNPLIVTTNLTLAEMRNAKDTPHRRIYDRVLAMCVPIFCRGESYRKQTAEDKLAELKRIIEGGGK